MLASKIAYSAQISAGRIESEFIQTERKPLPLCRGRRRIPFGQHPAYDQGSPRRSPQELLFQRGFSTMLCARNCARRGLHRVLTINSAFRNVWSISEVFNQSRNRPQLVMANARSFSSSEARMDPQKLRQEWGKPSFEVEEMTRLLDHDNHEKRAKFRKVLSEDPLMTPKYNISLDEERELALKRLKKLCDQGFISVLDFKNNPLWIFAAHELVAVVDAAMATKMTVQFNLFGGTVLKLGTERHHEKLLKVTYIHI